MPESLVKAAIYAALLLAIGAAAARILILPRVAGLERAERDRIERGLAGLLRRAAILFVAALCARLLAHTAAAFGAAAMFDGARLRLVGGGSRWGASWRAQLFAGGALLASALLVRPLARAGWALAALTTLAAAATIPLLGHAAGSQARFALHLAHILGGGLWLGTLGALTLVPGPSADRGAMLRAFSGVAFAGAALLVPTGVVAAWLYLGSIPALWTTPYGRTLSMKVALVAATLACGYGNWQRFRRERSTGERAAWVGVGSLAALEATLAVAIVLVTSWLTELAHP